MAVSRPLCLLICLFTAIVLASGQPSVTHYHGGGGGSGYSGPGREPAIGARSKFNPATKQYEPVTSDKSYYYFRIAVNIEHTFIDVFRPDPAKNTIIQIVNSGNVFDNTTGTLVGTYDSFTISTLLKAENQLQYLVSIAWELGPNGDDAIFFQASLERANTGNIPEVVDYDLAITGGTGRYKGATGEVLHFGNAVTEPDSDALYVAELAAPRFRRF